MREVHDGSYDFLAQLGQLFLALLNFFIQSLVLNLQLLEIYHVKAVSQLLLFLYSLLAVSKTVATGDVLKSVLMNLLILLFFTLFPFFNQLRFNLKTGTGMHCVLGN